MFLKILIIIPVTVQLAKIFIISSEAIYICDYFEILKWNMVKNIFKNYGHLSLSKLVVYLVK